jgi:hypothetical protein
LNILLLLVVVVAELAVVVLVVIELQLHLALLLELLTPLQSVVVEQVVLGVATVVKVAIPSLEQLLLLVVEVVEVQTQTV